MLQPTHSLRFNYYMHTVLCLTAGLTPAIWVGIGYKDLPKAFDIMDSLPLNESSGARELLRTHVLPDAANGCQRE